MCWSFEGSWSAPRNFVSRRCRTASAESCPSRSTGDQLTHSKVGTPPPPNPSGIPLGRRAVPFVCVLGGGGVPTYRQCSIPRDHIGPGKTHGAPKSRTVIENDVLGRSSNRGRISVALDRSGCRAKKGRQKKTPKSRLTVSAAIDETPMSAAKKSSKMAQNRDPR